MSISLINSIDTNESSSVFKNLEQIGDFSLYPTRLLFGRSYHLDNDKNQLKSHETFAPIKILGAVVFFPITLIGYIFGIAFKKMAHIFEP